MEQMLLVPVNINRGCSSEEFRFLLADASKKKKCIDHIATALQVGIEKAIKRSFTLYLLSPIISVRKGDRARPILGKDGIQIGWSAYYIANKYLSVNTPRSVNYCENTKRVTIKCGEQYVSVFRLLQSFSHILPMDEMTETGAHREVLYHQWCATNGKSFPFLRLPAELREQIYHLALPTVVRPHSDADSTTKSQHIERSHMISPLLLVSKRVRSEASWALYRVTHFVFRQPATLTRILTTPGSRTRLGHIQFAFTVSEFLHLFSHGSWRFHAALSRLRNLGLRSLVLRVLQDSHHCSSPDCLGAHVDEMVCRAWPWVRGHPVVLCGEVPKECADPFNAEAKAEHKAYTAWVQSKKKVSARSVDSHKTGLSYYLSRKQCVENGGEYRPQWYKSDRYFRRLMDTLAHEHNPETELDCRYC